MLAEGYAFQYVGTENFVEYNKAATNQVNTISHVRVVKCPHAKVNEDGHCAYCNAAGTDNDSRRHTNSLRLLQRGMVGSRRSQGLDPKAAERS